MRIGNLFIGLPPGQKDPNGSRWQIASQHHFTGVAEYSGITGRIKLDWVAGYFRNRWPDDLGLRTKVRVFPNLNSLERLSTAVLVEIDEKWETETKAYIKWEQLDE